MSGRKPSVDQDGLQGACTITNSNRPEVSRSLCTWPLVLLSMWISAIRVVGRILCVRLLTLPSTVHPAGDKNGSGLQCAP